MSSSTRRTGSTRSWKRSDSGRFPAKRNRGVITRKSSQHVLEHPRDVVVIAIVGKTAAEGDRAGRKHRAACRRLKIDNLGPDQRFRWLAGRGHQMVQQFLGHDHEMALVALRTRQDQRIGRGPQLEIRPVELETGGTASG